jgi:DNA-binding GntR family transcriptional regulator
VIVPATPKLKDNQESLTSASATARVMDEIRNLIVTGEFLPGQSLGQAALAERLAVSRVPVREALKGLQMEGVVTHRHNVGYVVARLDAFDLEQIYIMRGLIEDHLLSTLSESTPAVIKELTRLNTETRKAADGVDIVRMTQLNRDFHMTLLSLSGQPLILDEARRLWARSEAVRVIYLYDEDARERILNDHDEMIAALRKNDRQTLRDLTVSHRGNSLSYVQRFLSRPALRRSAMGGSTVA